MDAGLANPGRHAFGHRGFSRNGSRRSLSPTGALLLSGCLVLSLFLQSGCSAGGGGTSAAIEPAKAAVAAFLEAIKRAC